jgi:UDP-glucuronate 4-epimerase
MSTEQPPETRTALVTGSAGFIGFHLCQRLLADGFTVIGIDSLNDYYDPALKTRRQSMLLQNPGFQTLNQPIETPGLLMDLMAQHQPQIMVHLAAQAGVRTSIDNPRAYVQANLLGTFELLEAARAFPPQHLLMASSSSVYGANTALPFTETQAADHPVSFYGATKKANEAMAHSYAHLFALPTSLFRFFTVYGPWGRPDMALFKFTSAILRGEPIDVYNHGQMQRDFTYVDDLVQAIRLLIDTPPALPDDSERPAKEPLPNDSLSPVAPFRVVNIGNSSAVPLMDFIAAIERATGQKAQTRLLPMQDGDVPATWADGALLQALTGYQPTTNVEQGVARFVAWYRDYYQA